MRLCFLLRSCCLAMLLLASALLGAAGPAQAQEGSARWQPVADSALSPGAVVAGILLYTRWPQERQPLQACLGRQGPETQQLRQQLPTSHAGRPLLLLDIEVDQPPPLQCDLIFFEGWNPALQRQVLRGLAHRPVLTLGLGAEFCSDGGLFCLQPQAGNTRFEVNLDAVARSGLRVHPQVLRLARPRPGAST